MVVGVNCLPPASASSWLVASMDVYTMRALNRLPLLSERTILSMDSSTELPPIATGVAVVHEGLLRATLNDIGRYAKKYDLTPEQVREIFDKGVIFVVRERPDRYASILADAVSLPR